MLNESAKAAAQKNKCFIPKFFIPNPVFLTTEAQRRGV